MEKSAARAAALKSQGKFIVATKVADAAQLPAETMMAADTAPSVSGERWGRFLTASLFCADSLVLTRPERLMAVLRVMGVARLVYALAAHPVRMAGERSGEHRPDQQGKPTPQPTLRRPFPLLAGMEGLWRRQPLGGQRFVLTWTPSQRQILHRFGPEGRPGYFPNACGMWDILRRDGFLLSINVKALATASSREGFGQSGQTEGGSMGCHWGVRSEPALASGPTLLQGTC